MLTKVIAGLSVIGGVVVGVSFNWSYGAGVGVTGLIVAAAIALFTNMPPPNKGKNPAGIDFGM